MVSESRIHHANALTLQWHAAALTLGLEAFQSWCLASLKPQLRFDCAVWGLLSDAGAATGRRINSAHVHRVGDDVIDRLEALRGDDFAATRAPGNAVSISLSDPAWAGPAHTELRDHARRHGLLNTLSIRFADAQASGQQFILLGRKTAGQRFGAEDVRTFELLAPHMMQAYVTCRRLFLDSALVGDRRSAALAVAMVDRAGMVHDQHARFVPMLQREWSDWPGHRLPEPLLELTARRAGTRWRFLGAQVTADFVPVDNRYLVTLRPRHVSDVLTPRENEVAQRYAAGGNFREIAESLNLAPATVRSHLRNVFGKLQIRNKSQLAASLR